MQVKKDSAISLCQYVNQEYRTCKNIVRDDNYAAEKV